MLGAGHDRLLHVAVRDSDDVRSSLCPRDDSSLALEAAVWHALLLSSVKNDCDAVTLGIGMHHSIDENTAAVGLLLLENAASALA